MAHTISDDSGVGGAVEAGAKVQAAEELELLLMVASSEPEKPRFRVGFYRIPGTDPVIFHSRMRIDTSSAVFDLRTVPYFTIPLLLQEEQNVKFGDLAVVVRSSNPVPIAAQVGGVRARGGFGSIALAEALGVPTGDDCSGSEARDFHYVVF